MMSNIAGGIVSENNAKGEEIKKAATRQRRKSRDLGELAAITNPHPQRPLSHGRTLFHSSASVSSAHA